ncbi:MAG TPA: FHA domain-containing protein [Kofleriaceae bacterium]|nr:FHA domain-containing protein [Kofleriaceae bacterium]
MATLKHLQTGAVVHLAARHVVGRSRTCQLQLDLASVSALHAELAWDGRAWHLRDLGSRNGTFVAGQRVPPGKPVALAPGTELGFGEPQAHYRFVDDSPPRLMAFGPDQVLVAEDDVLCLPSADECEVIVFRGADERWVIETPEGTRPFGDGECVVLRGQPFHVHLPGGMPATRDIEAPREDAPDEGVLELRVSRDGEHVDLCFRLGDRVRPFEARAHAFLLLALARTRLQDAAAGQLPESEHGWMHREDLMKELAIDDPQLLNLWVYRARQQLAQMKLRSASQLIERREGAGQLRLGLRLVRVVDA